MARTSDALRLRVDDDGPATGSGPARGGKGPAGGAKGPTVGGNGLVGMRERAAALGGEVRAGPRDDGGFTVRATLPLRGDDGAGGGRTAAGNEEESA